MGESLLQVIRGAFAVRKNHKTGGNMGRGKTENEKTEYDERGAKGARPEMESAGKKLNIDISASGARRRHTRPKGHGLARKSERKKRTKN